MSSNTMFFFRAWEEPFPAQGSQHQLPVGPQLKQYSLKWPLLKCKGPRLEDSVDHWNLGINWLNTFFKTGEARKSLSTRGKKIWGWEEQASQKGKKDKEGAIIWVLAWRSLALRQRLVKPMEQALRAQAPVECVFFLAFVSGRAQCSIKLFPT